MKIFVFFIYQDYKNKTKPRFILKIYLWQVQDHFETWTWTPGFLHFEYLRCRCSTIRILWITICISHRQGALLPCPKIRKRRVVLPSSSQQQMTERVSRHCAFTSTRLNVCLIRAETFQSTFLSSCESFVWDYFMARLWNHHPQTNKTTT